MLFLIEYHIFYNPNIFNITFGCHRWLQFCSLVLQACCIPCNENVPISIYSRKFTSGAFAEKHNWHLWILKLSLCVKQIKKKVVLLSGTVFVCPEAELVPAGYLWVLWLWRPTTTTQCWMANVKQLSGGEVTLKIQHFQRCLIHVCCWWQL